ncbi:MAG: radical SAM protein, partial [Anaerolineae bacterium]
MQSPEYVQTSLAGAITLGLAAGRFAPGVRLGALNLLLTYPEGCAAACSYCGLARDRQRGSTFIRVPWPTYPLAQIVARLREYEHGLQRACISMVAHRRALEDTIAIAAMLHRDCGMPISILATPGALRGRSDMEQLREAGADRLGIAVDAATPELFARHRPGLRWERYWRAVEEGASVFGLYHVGVHLIVGLGETEQQMVQAMQAVRGRGACTHLFSFYPEAGSRLESGPRPPMGQYRRVQLARQIIDEGLGSAEDMIFNEAGQITAFGIDIEPLLRSGAAFMTSGCPGADGRVACNRPFGNERPGEPWRNYPLEPTAEDLALIRSQLWQ